MTQDEFIDTLLRNGTASVDLNTVDWAWTDVADALAERPELEANGSLHGAIFTANVAGNRADREGENNPMPTAPAENASVQDELIRLIEDRRRLGVERYGQPLRVFNGRNALVDARDEAIDLATYLTQCVMESEATNVS